MDLITRTRRKLSSMLAAPPTREIAVPPDPVAVAIPPPVVEQSLAPVPLELQPRERAQPLSSFDPSAGSAGSWSRPAYGELMAKSVPVYAAIRARMQAIASVPIIISRILI